MSPFHLGPAAASKGRPDLPIFDVNRDTPGTPSQEYLAMFPDWQLADDLDGGVRRMRWRNTAYLPQEEKEETGQYLARLKRSALFPGFASGLDSSVSKPYSRPVKVDGVPSDDWERWLRNVNGEGADLTQFLRAVQRNGIKHGLVHVLADFTSVEARTGANGEALPPTVADVLNIGPRPISKMIPAPCLLSWVPKQRKDGTMGLGEIRVHAIESEQDGDYKTTRREFVRVIRPTSFELWENKAYKPPATWRTDQYADPLADQEFYDHKQNRTTDWQLVDEGAFGPQEPGRQFETVPLVTIYYRATGFMTATPAMKELAEVNLTHWQSASDQRNIAHVVRVPVLFAAGFNQEEIQGGITIGAGTAIASQSESARLSYVEHSGAAMALGMDDLERLEQQMERLGIRPLIERTGDMTATGAAMNANDANTDAQAWILATQTGARQMLALWGVWTGADPAKVAEIEVDIFNDFAAAISDSGERDALFRLYAERNLTRETLLREMARRGLFRDGWSAETELEAIAEMEARILKAEAATTEQAAPATGENEGPGGDESQEAGASAEPKAGLNGAQVTALQGVVQAVSDGTMPAAAAVLLIQKAFPTFTADEIRAMIDSADAFEPATATGGGGGMPQLAGSAAENNSGGTPVGRND